jgi:hypothetical protein
LVVFDGRIVCLDALAAAAPGYQDIARVVNADGERLVVEMLGTGIARQPALVALGVVFNSCIVEQCAAFVIASAGYVDIAEPVGGESRDDIIFECRTIVELRPELRARTVIFNGEKIKFARSPPATTADEDITLWIAGDGFRDIGCIARSVIPLYPNLILSENETEKEPGADGDYWF